MKTLDEDEPMAVAVKTAIQTGEVEQLQSLLDQNQNLATTWVIQKENNVHRSLLHLATDWPGHFPRVEETIAALAQAGADVNATMQGPNPETPLHWAASSDDVAAIDALLDAGADLNSPGAVIAGGDPLQDAIGFQNWAAAQRLVERGAATKLGDEAALGLIDRMTARFQASPTPGIAEINYSFWNACWAGQLEAAQFLLDQRADVNWIPDWCEESPLDGAIKSENKLLVEWLEKHGASRNVE